MTIWRMCIARWIPKSTNRLRICNTCCIFTAKIVRRKHLSASLLHYSVLPVVYPTAYAQQLMLNINTFGYYNVFFICHTTASV